jgi:hypothetical protein
MLPKHASSNPPDPVKIELHGLKLTWNGQPLASPFALKQRCGEVGLSTAGNTVTLLSGLDTSRQHVARIEKILRQDCGFRQIIYEVFIVVGDRKKR